MWVRCVFMLFFEEVFVVDFCCWVWLFFVGIWCYYVLLLVVGMGVLGLLGGIMVVYMNFVIGFFIGG